MCAICQEPTDCTKRSVANWSGLRKEKSGARLRQTFAQRGNPTPVWETGDKVLTLLCRTCDNICNRFEDFMARQNGRGSSRPRVLIRQVPIQKPTPVSARTYPPRAIAFVLTLIASFILEGVPSASAQTPDVDEIHISPRIEPEKSDRENVLDTVRAHAPTMKSKVDLVLVPVTVTDPMNRLVTGLDKENFQVYEGKEQQDLRHFSSEDAPISLGVIFDMSGSMSSKVERAREAVTEFFKTANPQDEFFMIAFADKPEEISDLTQSEERSVGKEP